MQASQEGFAITWRQISTVACSESLKAGTKKCVLSKTQVEMWRNIPFLFLFLVFVRLLRRMIATSATNRNS
jgi:ABC-type microcin C transport system permease subunit YejE